MTTSNGKHLAGRHRAFVHKAAGLALVILDSRKNHI
jgi:hypothetical protein